GSPPFTADATLLGEISNREAHVSQIPTRVLDAHVTQQSAGRVVLEVVEQTGAYDYLDTAGQVLAHKTAGPQIRTDLTLIRTAPPWPGATSPRSRRARHRPPAAPDNRDPRSQH